MRVSDSGAKKATRVRVEPALGRGLKSPGEFAEEEGFEPGRCGGAGRLPKAFQIGESELCEGFEAGFGSHGCFDAVVSCAGRAGGQRVADGVP